MPVAWIGLLLNIGSGILLVVAYPTKALTNPIFYLKLLVIVAAVAVVRHLDGRVLKVEAPTRKLVPAALLVLTALAIVTGRLLPYTYRHLMAGHYMQMAAWEIWVRSTALSHFVLAA